MGKFVSMFIMDVTNSSKFENGRELSDYLSFWTNTLNQMNSFIDIKAKHRMGDEIICLVEDYYTAYLLANYMVFHWKYKNHMPYFGLTCDYINEEVVDIETWNDPMVRRARDANELIKADNSRKKLMFFMQQSNQINISNFNLIMEMQNNFILQQTDKQREILSLYSLMNSQKEVAIYLNKTGATISSHYTKGNVELILKGLDGGADTLKVLQAHKMFELFDSEEINEKYDEFNKKLKEILKIKLLNN